MSAPDTARLRRLLLEKEEAVVRGELVRAAALRDEAGQLQRAPGHPPLELEPDERLAARAHLERAADSARERGAAAIGTADLLLAALRRPGGRALIGLEGLGAGLAEVERALQELLPPAAPLPRAPEALDEDARLAVRRAVLEARTRGQETGTLHLLLGLLAAPLQDSPAARALARVVDENHLFLETKELLHQDPSDGPG